MKKFTRILAVLMAAVMAMTAMCVTSSAVSADDYGKLANEVDSNKYWVVYHEGSSRDRVELSTFTVNDGFKTVWNKNLSAIHGGSYKINHYYYDGSKFVFFETYPNLLSGNCTKIYASNVDIYDSNSKIVFKKTYGNNSSSSESTTDDSMIILYLEDGDKVNIGALIGGKKASSVKYSSSNTKVVTVSSKGKIKAKSEGKAIISAKSGKTTVKIQVVVEEDD